MKTFRIISLLLVVLFFGGCTQRVLDFTLISSKNVDLSKASTFVKDKNRVQGEDVVHIIISIPTGTVSMKEALDRAIESTPGCVALVDGVIYSKFFYVLFYGQSSIIVEGSPLVDPGVACNSDIPAYRKIELNSKGEVKGLACLTASEYNSLKDKIVKESLRVDFQNSSEIR